MRAGLPAVRAAGRGGMVRPRRDRADRAGIPRAAGARRGGCAGLGVHPLSPDEAAARTRTGSWSDAGGQRRGDREGGGRGLDTTGARGGSEQSPDPPLRRVGRRAAFSQGRGAILGREAAARRGRSAGLTTNASYVFVIRLRATS